LLSDTTCAKAAEQTSSSADLLQKSHYANLVRYVPSEIYFARIRVKGKLIRKSLKTDTLSVAKLRLAWQIWLLSRPIFFLSRRNPGPSRLAHFALL
jgi:hypothetical protein